MKNLIILTITSLILLSADNIRATEPDIITERLQAYIQINTSNPPGNETAGVKFLADILAAEGIPFETAESAPGRGNIWATLKGGDEPALLLLHHIDVVPANAKFWDVDPYSGAILDGYVYGRGAVDTKGLGIAQLHAFLALHRSGRKLNRDVIYMATADEEAGGFFGAGWLLQQRPELFQNVGYIINEGGSGTVLGDTPAFSVEVTQKVPLWIRLTATDIPGHGSAPRVTSSVKRILRAGYRISESSFEPRVVPAVASYFAAIAPYQTGERQQLMADIGSAIGNQAFMLSLQIDQPWQAALLRNTCSLTTLEGSNKINVVPPTASLELDCRLLPDQDPEIFVDQLKTIINDPQVEIHRIMSFTPAISPQNTPLYESIREVVALSYENAVVIPSVSTGFTDSHFFRDEGIVAYGFAPFFFPPDERSGVHGNNERISIENLHRGAKILRDLLIRFATVQ